MLAIKSAGSGSRGFRIVPITSVIEFLLASWVFLYARRGHTKDSIRVFTLSFFDTGEDSLIEHFPESRGE